MLESVVVSWLVCSSVVSVSVELSDSDEVSDSVEEPLTLNVVELPAKESEDTIKFEEPSVAATNSTAPSFAVKVTVFPSALYPETLQEEKFKTEELNLIVMVDESEPETVMVILSPTEGALLERSIIVVPSAKDTDGIDNVIQRIIRKPKKQRLKVFISIHLK